MSIQPLNKQYPRTLSTLSKLPLNITDVWLFESGTARRAEQLALARSGRAIRIHSAYKSLLHNVLEQHVFDDADSVCIRYPVVENDEPLRFRLECYPLQELFPDIDVTFLPVNFSGQGLPRYQLTVCSATNTREHVVEAPVKWKAHASGRRLLVATGWMKSADGKSATMQTEFEQLYDDICNSMQSMPLKPMQATEPQGPFFDQLDICVTGPFQDEALPVNNESISLAEALHEDIYFTAIEIFQKRLDLPALSRDLTPGQIVPNICRGESISVSIATTVSDSNQDRDQAGCPSLSQATHWLYPSQIRSHLQRVGGKTIRAISRQGRLVEGRVIVVDGLPDSAALAISAAQHANESSGVVGALRAAQALQQKGDVSFSVCPVENVDGYALYHRLCLHNPNHMHHAARYTAGGNDLTHGGGAFESAIRQQAMQALPARVHVNLHGYPAHEWTRPLSGYVPEGFSHWTIPKGFFLICDYADDEYLALATQVLDAALQALHDYPEMMAINQRMLRSYERVIGSLDFTLYRDCIPYTLNRQFRKPYPVSLITEAPDESVYGEDFRIAHEAHYRVIMAVAETMACVSTSTASTTGKTESSCLAIKENSEQPTINAPT